MAVYAPAGSSSNMVENESVPEKKRLPLVHLRSVVVRNDRGDTVFGDLNLLLPAGRSAVIIGSAGAGKTLLAELLVGLRRHSAGTVELFGQNIAKRRRRAIRKCRRLIGGVGGLFGLVPTLTVAENIALPMVIVGERKKIQQERLRKMLTEFSLLKQAGVYPHQLTRVENSLVQYARASVASQPLLIVDEPAAGLDHKTFKRIHEFLVKVSISGRSMIIMTSDNQLEDLPNTDYYTIAGGRLQ